MRPLLLVLIVLLCPTAGAEPLADAFERLESWGFSGTVAAGEGEETRLLRGYGLADREADLAFTPDTRLPWLSLSKPMTGALALRLEQTGVLALHHELGRYYPDAPADKAGIRLDQLLSHTSGLAAQLQHPDFSGPPEFEPIDRATLEQRALDSQPLKRPGTRFIYSNLGFNLAAAVMEQASRRAFAELMKEELLLPAGLMDSQIGGLPVVEEAVGYDGAQRWGRFSERAWPDGHPGWNLIGAGALIGHTRDLARIPQLMRGAAPVDPRLARRWREARISLANGEDYGLGLSLSEDARGKHIGHDGGFGPFSAELAWWPRSDEWLVITSNTRHFRAWELRQALMTRQAEGKVAWPPSAPQSPLPTVIAASPRTRWVALHPEGGCWKVSRIDDRLEITAYGQAATRPLVHDGPAYEESENRGLAVIDRLRALLHDSAHRPPAKSRRDAAIMYQLLFQFDERLEGKLTGLDHLATYPAPDGKLWITELHLRSDEDDATLRIYQEADGAWKQLEWTPADPGIRVVLRHVENGVMQGLWIRALRPTATFHVDESGTIQSGDDWRMPLAVARDTNGLCEG